MLFEMTPASTAGSWLQESTGNIFPIVLPEPPDNIIIVSGIWQPLTRMFHGSPAATADMGVLLHGVATAIHETSGLKGFKLPYVRLQ
jgi:hypothetical protein